MSTVSRYMVKVFFSYFLAIAIPICLLSMFYLTYTVPKIREQYTLTVEQELKTEADKMSGLMEKVSDFSYLVSSVSFTRDLEVGEYKDNVYSYTQIISMMNQYVQNNEFIKKMYVYVKHSKKVLSSDSYVEEYDGFKDCELIENAGKRGKNQSFFINGTEMVIVTTLPKYYYDDTILLLFYVDLDKMYSGMEQTSFYIYTKDEMPGPAEHMGKVYTVERRKETVWYILEPYSGLCLSRVYDMSNLNEIVWSSIKVTILLLTAVMVVILLISAAMTRVHVKPIRKLSDSLKRRGQGTESDNIFDFITESMNLLQDENESYSKSLEQNKHLIKDHAIREMLWSRVPEDEPLESFLLQSYVEIIPEYFFAVLIETSGNLVKHRFGKLAEINILAKNLVEQKAEGVMKLVGSTLLELNQIAFIVKNEDHNFSPEDIEKIRTLFEAVAMELLENLSIQSQIIVGYPVHTTESLCRSFVGMRRRLDKAAMADSRVVFQTREEGWTGQFPVYLQTGLVNSIKAGNTERISLIIDQILQFQMDQNENITGTTTFLLIGNTITDLMNTTDMVDQEDLKILDIFRMNISEAEKSDKLKTMLLTITEKFESHNIRSEDNAYIQNADEYIKKNLNRDLALGEIADYIGINVSYFSRIFKMEKGVTPLQYIAELRIEQAKELLVSGDYTIKEISEMVGYNDTRSLIRFFKKLEGCTPGEYKVKEKCERIKKHEQ